MLIQEFIANALREVQRGLAAAGAPNQAPGTMELDFPIAVVVSRSQPGQQVLEVPRELSSAANAARVRLSIALPIAPNVG